MPQTRRLKLADFGRVLAEDLRTLQKRVVEATHAAAEDGKVIAQAKAPEAFGELHDGIVDMGLKNGGRVRSTAPYSAAVEVGSRPHRPPLEPIIAWVKLRGMQGLHGGAKDTDAPGRVRSMFAARERRGTSSVDDPVRIARAIANGIAKHGTKPTWFMKNSVPLIYEALDNHVHRILERPL